MNIRSTQIPGLFTIDIEAHVDERGSFARVFCRREFERYQLYTDFVQCNLSRNIQRGTLRGMHYQVGPNPEVKLVRCIAGAIYDVAVDLRPHSPTYRQWFSMELTAQSCRALYIPGGMAHGFITLEDQTDVFYQMGDYYSPEASRGFRWDDASFGIRWPARPTVISHRDATYLPWQPSDPHTLHPLP